MAGLIDFVIDLAERRAMERQRVKVGMDKRRHETEVEIRKIAIAKLYPNDYKEHCDLSDPLRCMFITESFKKNEKQCADKGGEDILCNIRRNYSRCEAIRKEVEKMRNPIATAKLEVEKYKRVVIAKAEAEGEL